MHLVGYDMTMVARGSTVLPSLSKGEGVITYGVCPSHELEQRFDERGVEPVLVVIPRVLHHCGSTDLSINWIGSIGLE